MKWHGFVRLGLSGAEAACSAHESPMGWRRESNLFDFHELRQGFSPPNQRVGKVGTGRCRRIESLAEI